MKHKILYLMALLLTVAVSARAQSSDSDPIDLLPSADGKVWTLPDGMPDYDVELEVTYYTDEEVAAMEEAAFTEGVELTYDATSGSWTLDATPAFDIELEVEYETALALNEVDDNTTKLADWDGYEADVTLTRTLQTGGWNTFTVPFDLAIPDGWKVKELTGANYDGTTLTLTFDDATSIEAGKPYLVKVGASVVNPTFDGVTIADGTIPITIDDIVSFVPAMNPTELPYDDKSYLFVAGGNSLTYPTGTGDEVSIKGFRAYFHILNSNITLARAFAMDFGDEVVTGIIGLSADGRSTDGVIYTLDGRRVNGQPMQKSVYIQNGKKLIIK